MRKQTVGPWVVYKKAVWGEEPGPNAVCEQAEWDEMERADPGLHTLIRAGIDSEPEAERLARSAPGGTALPGHRPKSRRVRLPAPAKGAQATASAAKGRRL
jgi:hypothetical protein